MKKSLKKIIATVLVTGMALVSMAVPASAAAVTDFADVKESSWYYNAVQYAVDNGLFAGTTPTTFSPEGGMTRGMFVTVLGRKAGVDESEYLRYRFDDVKVGEYFAPYVEWAATYGIVSGTSETKFSPNTKITREQMAAILYRYAQRTGTIKTDEYEYYKGSLDNFGDGTRVSNYAYAPLQWAIDTKIIKGTGEKMDWFGITKEKLAPQGIATRAQVAQIFLNSSDILVNDEIYPDGSFWLTNGKLATPENITEAIYALKEKYPEGMEWGDSNGENCATFAYDIWWDVFKKQSQDETEENPAVFDTLRPGDHIRYANETTQGHSVIVVEKHEDYIIVVEGNYGGTVHWGRTMTKNELENSDIFRKLYISIY